jgi:hypothetical protein
MMSRIKKIECNNNVEAYLDTTYPIISHFYHKIKKIYDNNENIDLYINDKGIFGRYDRSVEIIFNKEFILFKIDETTTPDVYLREILISNDSFSKYTMNRYK